MGTDKGYVALATRVITCAYRDLVRAYMMKRPYDIKELKRFFRESPFMGLFDIDPEYMIRKAREESEENRRKRT